MSRRYLQRESRALVRRLLIVPGADATASFGIDDVICSSWLRSIPIKAVVPAPVSTVGAVFTGVRRRP